MPVCSSVGQLLTKLLGVVGSTRFECAEPTAEAGELFRRQLGSGFGDRLSFPQYRMVLVWFLLRSTRPRRSLLNLAHISVVYSGNLTILPRDRDRIPARLGDNAAVSSIALPIDATAFLEAFGFGDCHC